MDGTDLRQAFRIALGKKLRQARESLGLSLSDVASICNVSRTAIHDYEQGTKEPSAWVLSRLAPALEMSLDAAILGKDQS